MAENNYTETCEVCGDAYAPTLNKNGNPRKTKYKLCGSTNCRNSMSYSAVLGTTERTRAKRKPRTSDDGARLSCSVGGCESHAITSGMCAKHYQRVRKYGSPNETLRGRRVSKPCGWCGKGMSLKPAEVKKRKCCSIRCAALFSAKNRGLLIHGSRKAKDSFYGARRRAATATQSGVSINPIKVFERDKWRCHLCGVKTLKSKRGTYDDRAPELDHIVALADGGSHTWGNVACSCRKCNSTKGARSLGQLGLVIAA